MERLTEWDGMLAKPKYSGDFGSQNIMSALASYEDADEQGLLLRLPCKPGTIVYQAYNIGGISGVDEHRLQLEDVFNFGKTVFLTKEEAEAKLKEMESD